MKLDEETKKYLRTYQLVTHGDRRNKESFFHVTLMADFLLKCLKMANYFGVFQPIDSNFSGDGHATSVAGANILLANSPPVSVSILLADELASESFSLFGRARRLEKADPPDWTK